MSSEPTSDQQRVRKERKFWSKVAPEYDDWVATAFDEQYTTFKHHMAESIGRADRVLEIGAGTGNIALHIAPHVGSVVGVDISPEMVKEAERKRSDLGISNVEFQVGDAYDLPFANGTFDRVVCVNVLQTMKEPARALGEARRVLRRNGELIAVTYVFGDSSPWETVKLARWVLKYGWPTYWSNLKSMDLSKLIMDAGFNIIKDEIIWESPRVVLVRASKRGRR
jgi:ubiquinone/menaquinone biosynthesis C-methylase UbiE